MSRITQFTNDEYYHIYNRGVDKRDIYGDRLDLKRFLDYLEILNRSQPVGSLRSYEGSMSKIKSSKNETPSEPLVEIICFCLNPNHYHLLVKQISDGGVSKFMHRLGTGYTMHFNDKNKRSGSLFQGRFKAVHIETNEYLLHLSVYINLNFEVHSKWRGEESPLTYSSWNEYLNKENKNICHKNIILDQFSSPLEYQSFAKGSLKDIQNRRVQDKVLDDYLLE